MFKLLTNIHMGHRSSKGAEMPRVAYLAIGIVAAAALLHSVLIPVVKQDQLAEANRLLAILDGDIDGDGIPNTNDRDNHAPRGRMPGIRR